MNRVMIGTCNYETTTITIDDDDNDDDEYTQWMTDGDPTIDDATPMNFIPLIPYSLVTCPSK